MLNVRWASRCKQSMIPPTTPSDAASDRRTSLEMRSTVETQVTLIEMPTLQIRAGWLSLGPTQFDPKRFVADSSFAVQIEIQRSYLLRVAMLQLRDAHLAEDIVQDTMVAALQGEAGFAGKSSLKTWVTGILKHKIVDAIRNKTRGPAFVSFDEECRIDDFDAMFDETGHWENPPADWGQPESQLSQKEFLETLHACLEKLPPNTSRVFMMREVMELEADEICKELTITSTNLWVILYRARMGLRKCLEQNWFASPAGSSRGSAAGSHA
jgi:RNA polymerase sigma-70 factor, ECF subfamily